jgi:hypothetical protein
MEFPAGHYRFRAGSDDGVRFWIDDKLLIDQWHGEPHTLYSIDVDLGSGEHTLRLEYFEAQLAASLSLNWEKDPDVVTRMECIRPYASLLDWWAGDGDGSNDRLGPALSLENGVKFTPGVVAQALLFESKLNGTPAYAPVVPFDQRLKNLPRFTIETWVLLEATAPGEKDPQRIQLQDKAINSVERFVSLGNNAVLRKEGDGSLHFYVNIEGGLRQVRSEKVLPRGEFIHVAGVYDGTWMVLYWNGKKVGALEVSGEVAPFNDLYLSSDAEPLFGILDEVSIYNTALSEGELMAIYTAGPFGKCK